MSENAKMLLDAMKYQVESGNSKTGSFNLQELEVISGIIDIHLIEAVKELNKQRKVTVNYSDNKPTIISLSNRQFVVTYK